MSNRPDGPAAEVSTQVLTLPNLITGVRIFLIPVFAWLFLTGKSDTMAFWILAILGGTDWVDGYVARRTGQISVLGKVLDPIADRAAVLSVLSVLAFRGTVSWPIAAAILLRDAVVSLVFIFLESRGFPRLPVNFTGKLATSILFLGMGIAAASTAFSALPGDTLRQISEVLLAFGAALYWAAGAFYLREIYRIGRGSTGSV